jgi:hypothetical protein
LTAALVIRGVEYTVLRSFEHPTSERRPKVQYWLRTQDDDDELVCTQYPDGSYSEIKHAPYTPGEAAAIREAEIGEAAPLSEFKRWLESNS